MSALVYLWINSRDEERAGAPEPMMSAADGFKLVLANPYLRLIALLIVLLNIVNTTGEYVVARLLTNHVNELAAGNAAFNKQAFIGAFTGDYQFWVNVLAFLLQAFVSSRLIKYRGLARSAPGAAAHRPGWLRDYRRRRRASRWFAGSRPWRTPPTTRS